MIFEALRLAMPHSSLIDSLCLLSKEYLSVSLPNQALLPNC